MVFCIFTSGKRHLVKIDRKSNAVISSHWTTRSDDCSWPLSVGIGADRIFNFSFKRQIAVATPISRATLSVLKVHSSFVMMMVLSQGSRKRQLWLSD